MLRSRPAFDIYSWAPFQFLPPTQDKWYKYFVKSHGQLQPLSVSSKYADIRNPLNPKPRLRSSRTRLLQTPPLFRSRLQSHSISRTPPWPCRRVGRSNGLHLRRRRQGLLIHRCRYKESRREWSKADPMLEGCGRVGSVHRVGNIFKSKKAEITSFHESHFQFASHIIVLSGNLNLLVKSIEVKVYLSYVFTGVYWAKPIFWPIFPKSSTLVFGSKSSSHLFFSFFFPSLYFSSLITLQISFLCLIHLNS